MSQPDSSNGESQPRIALTQSGRARIMDSRRSIAVRLFLTCWLVYALHFATNTVREIYPALSLGDHLSFDVSEYLGLHPDIFELPGRGVFINNNPGASILAAVPYALARPIIDPIVNRVQKARADAPESDDAEYDTIYPMAQEFFREARARGFDVKFGLAAAVMQMLLMAPLSALSVVVMFYVLDSLTGSRRKALWLAILFAFATPVFYRTAQLNHNLLQADFAFFSFVMLWRPWDDPGRPKRPRYFLAGLLAGWTVVLDYSGLVIVAAIGLYALARRRSLPEIAKRATDIPHFAAGLTLCAAVLMGYQWATFGNPLLPAQQYMPETTFSQLGYNGIDWPSVDLIWQNSFGLRFGLFTSAPFLLLALFVPAWFGKGMRIIERREATFILLFSTAFLLFTSANQFSRMQFNSGVRHMVPVVPFLFLLAAGTFLKLPRLMGMFFGFLTTYWSWCLAMYRDVEQGLGIPESLIHITLQGFQLPWMKTIERMGYLGQTSAVPLLLLAAVTIWILWNARFPDRGGSERISTGL